MVKLYEHQEKALTHILENDRCALWLECGLGKTLITIEALKQLPKPAIVLAPKRVVDNTWSSELDKWWPNCNYQLLTGTPTQRNIKVKKDADVYIINFELVTWLITNHKWKYPTVVIDESTKVKNRATKLFKALRKVAGKWKHHIQLTGTPSPKGLIDLWAQVYLLDRGQRLGKTLTAFRDRWFDADYMGWSYEPKINADDEIHNLCSDICISMSKDDYLDLPDMMVTDIRLDLPPKVTNQYNQLKKKLTIEIGDTNVTAMTAGVLTNKLLQLTSGSVYDDNGVILNNHDTKIKAVQDIIDTIGDESLIVVYQFKHELEQLRLAFPDGVELRDRTTSVEEFNNGFIKLLFIHPASAGHGLNLQKGGRHLVWTTPTWNLEHYIQTNARLHRNGQTMPVMIYRLLANNTIDDKVVDSIENKTTVQDALMNALRK